VSADFSRVCREVSVDDLESVEWAGAISEHVGLMFKSLLLERVLIARAGGVTWQEIGDALGMSRQSAQQRFGG
jgi:hypothetical protein